MCRSHLWYPRPDSNRHSLRHYHLKVACLPIPPLGLVKPYSSDSGTAGTSLVAAGAVSSTVGTSDCGICGTSNGTGTPSAAIDVLFFAMIAKPKLVQKKTVARIAVARVKKLLPPWLPNTVCEAPPPKD